MCFVKGATPIKGKGVPVPKGMVEEGRTVETWKKKPKGKFIEEDEVVSSEAAVLKPCVYKLR
jgi:ribosomal RNA-processing protein 8